eukprot:3521167-Pyramimonas_sp.AAC.1
MCIRDSACRAADCEAARVDHEVPGQHGGRHPDPGHAPRHAAQRRVRERGAVLRRGEEADDIPPAVPP